MSLARSVGNPVKAVRGDFIILLAAALFFIAFFSLAYLKFRSHNTLVDLPIYSHAMWNTLHGRLMFTTTVYIPEGYNHLGDHLSLTLLLFLPVYALFPSPITLLLIQSFFLVIGAFPIYRLAKERLGERAALLFAAAYLLHPTLWYSNLNDFHLTSIAAGLVSFAFYYCYKKEYRKFLVFLGLILGTKEDLILLGVTFGAYIYFVNRDKLLGAVVAGGSLLWFIVAIKFLMPYFRGDVFEAPELYLTTRYGYLGSTFSEVVRTIVFHPMTVISNVVTLPKMAYLVSLLLPVLFLPLLSLKVLFLLSPVLAENLLSSYLWQYLPTTQYSTVMIPVLYAAGVLGAHRVKAERRKLVVLAVLMASLFSNLAYGPPPQGLVWKIGPGIESSYAYLSFTVDYRDIAADKVLAMIPEDASLAASSNLLIHAPMRERMYQTLFVDVSFIQENVDYVLFDTEGYFYRKFDHEEGLLRELSSSPGFSVVWNESGYVLFVRRAAS